MKLESLIKSKWNLIGVAVFNLQTVGENSELRILRSFSKILNRSLENIDPDFYQALSRDIK